MQGKIRGVILTTVGALALLGVGVGPALASPATGNPQPCTATPLQCAGGINATVTVNSELTLTLSTSSFALTPAPVAGIASTPSSGSTAEDAAVASYDPAGYTLNLVNNNAGFVSGSNDGWFAGTNPANHISIDNAMLSVLQGPGPGTPYPSGGVSQMTLGAGTSGHTGGTGCSTAPKVNGNAAGAGCVDGSGDNADDWNFGFSLSVPASTVADSYTSAWTVQAVGS